MKDGRPSLIFDIRYFGTDRTSYLEGHHDVTAFGRRMAWYLNGEKFSAGSYHSLYVSFSTKLPAGEIRISDDGGDWWQRYTYVGVPPDFPQPESSSAIAVQGTLAALKAIRPDATGLIDDAGTIVSQQADNLRFLIRSKTFRRWTVNVTSTISNWPDPSQLHVSLIDRQTGDGFEAKPVPLQFHDCAFDLSGSIRLNGTDVRIDANKGLTASSIAHRHGWPFVQRIDSFEPQPSQPCVSRLVQRPR